MSSRIYLYKITFEEVPHYYYGIHKEKKFNEYYMGSPVTHRWYWIFYTPKKQILQFFTSKKEANIIENRIIKFCINDPLCLNENCGGIISTKMCKKGAQILVENKLGIHGRSKEQIKLDGDKGRETQKKLKIGIYSMSIEERKKIGKKVGDRNVETGHIQNLGRLNGKLNKENNLGIFSMSEKERKDASSKGGKISGNNAIKNKTGIHSFTKEERITISKRGGDKNVETGHIQNLGKRTSKILNNRKWKCLETGYITTAGPLTVYQRARGIDTKLRIPID